MVVEVVPTVGNAQIARFAAACEIRRKLSNVVRRCAMEDFDAADRAYGIADARVADLYAANAPNVTPEV